jgi:hypothetical protein
MRHRWSSFILLLALAASANAQITRTATFENFTVGQTFKPSFTDPISGIIFTNSTGPTDDFDIADGLVEFSNDNYLGSGSPAGWSWEFGFTGKLPAPADQVSIEVSDGGIGYDSNVTLEGLDKNNNVIAEQSGISTPPGTFGPDPFTIQIISPDYNVVSFQVIAVGIFTGYDNITYTILPEPTPISCLFLAISFPILNRRKITASKPPSNQLES